MMNANQIKGWLQLARPPVNARKSEKEQFTQAVNLAIEAVSKMEKQTWIPVKYRETTDGDGIDKEEYPFYMECQMPEDDQEILVRHKNRKWVSVDTCFYDDGYSLDSGWDWIDDVVAWMPMPDPYEENEFG